MPPEPEPLKRGRLLAAWARLATARPWATIAVFVLLAAASAFYTGARLEFRSDRSDLVDPSTPWQQRYAAFKRAFPRWDDAVVVVDLSTAADAAAGEAYLAALESRLRADPAHFKAVTAGFDRAAAPPGLIYSGTLAQVREAVDELKRAAPVLAQPSLAALLELSLLGGDRLPLAQQRELAGLLERIHAAGARRADGRGADDLSVLGFDAARGTQRLVSSTGRLATVLVSLRREGAREGDGLGGAIRALRGHLKALRADPRFTGIRAGVTGVPVLESDETAQSTRDAAIASAISLGLIAILMLVAYHGFVVPMLAVASLLIGMALSFAWATFAVGHLQLLSVTFASILLGLGIDVAIHLIARLELVHPDHDHLAHAIEETFRGVGPGILTASITVAAAAGAMAFTSFSGVGEMGVIAAGGMILCTIAIMTAFPAMLMVIRRPEDRLREHGAGTDHPFMGRLGIAFHRRPRTILVAGAILFAVAGWLGTRVRYDPDLQRLMPDTTESIVWQNALDADDSKSVWHAVVVAPDEAAARELTARLRALPLVAEVGGAGMLWPSPADADAKRALLRGLPDPGALGGAGAGAFPADPAALRRAAGAIARQWRGRNDGAGLAAAAVAVESLDDAALDAAQRAYEADRASLAGIVRSLRVAEPPRPDDLPPELKAILLGTGGELLLRVYPAGPHEESRIETPTAAGEGTAFASSGPAERLKPEARSSKLEAGSPLAPSRLGPFARQVLAAAPNATGPSIQIYESTALITSAYARAGVYALIAIVVLLLLDFGLNLRGLLDTLCALVPVLGGATLLLAWMAVFEIPLNFANMIVMPLIVGIGVGCGVHAVRRWRLQPRDEPLGLAGGSGRGMTLTTLTTVIGFAAMLIAQHRGIRSLGFVMSVGLVMVWAVTILILPAVLRARARIER